MRMIIEESAIESFSILEEIAWNRKTCSVSFLDIHAETSEIIASFQALSYRRPKLKKVGIYTIITLKNLHQPLTEESCQQILNQYVHGIGWDDLQSISFWEITPDSLHLHIIFNRVTPTGKLIDLACLGADWKQYELLQRCCSQVVQKSLSQWDQGKLNSSSRVGIKISV